jgi:dTDP-4-amino-4,6-dideoxygalactose transaminase
MNDLNAAIGLGNLENIQWVLDKHISNAYKIIEGIKGMTKIGVIPNVPSRTNQFWVLTILVDNVDSFIKFLSDNDISASRVHARNDQHDCFRSVPTDLYGLNEFYSHQVSIPCGWWLSDEDIDKIVNTVRRYSNGV